MIYDRGETVAHCGEYVAHIAHITPNYAHLVGDIIQTMCGVIDVENSDVRFAVSDKNSYDFRRYETRSASNQC